MKLDRDINTDRKGKYAVVRLRNIKLGDEAHDLLERLKELGHLDWGAPGYPDEFFVIKLRDKYADAALEAYANAVLLDSQRESDEERSKSKYQYAIAVQKLLQRAGSLSEFCKEPD